MKTNGELLNEFKKKEPNITITDVYDDNDELMIRGIHGKQADFYFMKKSDGSIRPYFTGSEIPRVSNIIQNNKKLNIQNEE